MLQMDGTDPGSALSCLKKQSGKGMPENPPECPFFFLHSSRLQRKFYLFHFSRFTRSEV
jgi:hypothetical protein